ncbi:unnamed protein product, partial [Effrenium voratum]
LPSQFLESLADTVAGWTRSMPTSTSHRFSLPSSPVWSPVSYPAALEDDVLKQRDAREADVAFLTECCASLMEMGQERRAARGQMPPLWCRARAPGAWTTGPWDARWFCSTATMMPPCQ